MYLPRKFEANPSSGLGGDSEHTDTRRSHNKIIDRSIEHDIGKFTQFDARTRMK